MVKGDREKNKSLKEQLSALCDSEEDNCRKSMIDMYMTFQKSMNKMFGIFVIIFVNVFVVVGLLSVITGVDLSVIYLFNFIFLISSFIVYSVKLKQHNTAFDALANQLKEINNPFADPKEEVAKEEISQDEIAKEEVVKEEMSQDDISKEDIAKEEIVKEEISKEDIAKEE